MIGSSQGTKQFFRLFLLLAIAWIGGVLILSVGYRLYRGKPIFRPDFPDARFLETWRSGSSNPSLVTKLSGARNVLWIAVTQGELWVSPHFPFNLMFLPEALHLDFRVPGRGILDVTERSSGLAEHPVQVRFRHATGDEDSFEIMVQDIDAFRKAVAAIRR